MAQVVFVPPASEAELRKIAVDRKEWAKEARGKDLHGSAKEWELTAWLAEEVIRARSAGD